VKIINTKYHLITQDSIYSTTHVTQAPPWVSRVTPEQRVVERLLTRPRTTS